MTCAHCHAQMPPTAGRCPRCGRVTYTRQGSPGAGEGGLRLDGCRLEPPSPKDFRAVPKAMALPMVVDLRPECSPVESQGQLGSCTSNAIIGAFEFQLRQTSGRMQDLSRLFVYYNARMMSGAAHIDNGATINQGMAALLAFGAPPESAWPYDTSAMATRPSEAAYEQARHNVPVEYARVDGIEHIRGALARKHPVVFASNIPQRCYDEAYTKGEVPMPTSTEMSQFDARDGTHAMLLVGYDRGGQVYHVRNSWGDGFGDRGYCRIPFDVFDTVMIPQTTWILGNLSASGAFDVVRPKVELPIIEGGVKDLAAKMREDLRGSLARDLDTAIADVKKRFTPGR